MMRVFETKWASDLGVWSTWWWLLRNSIEPISAQFDIFAETKLRVTVIDKNGSETVWLAGEVFAIHTIVTFFYAGLVGTVLPSEHYPDVIKGLSCGSGRSYPALLSLTLQLCDLIHMLVEVRICGHLEHWAVIGNRCQVATLTELFAHASYLVSLFLVCHRFNLPSLLQVDRLFADDCLSLGIVSPVLVNKTLHKLTFSLLSCFIRL